MGKKIKCPDKDLNNFNNDSIDNTIKEIKKRRRDYLLGNIYSGNMKKSYRIPRHIINKMEKDTESVIRDLKRKIPCLRKTKIRKAKKNKEKNNIVMAVTQIKEIYSQILELCKIYKTRKSKYYNNIILKKMIKSALQFMRENYYNDKVKEHTNWWQWEIGIPLLINDIFILTEEEFGKEMKENLKSTKFFQPDPGYSGNNPVAIHPSGNPLRKSTGGNRVDTVKISLLRAVLLKDIDEINLALKALGEVYQYKEEDNCEDIGNERDGFYKDGSFIQHGSIPYTGTYGNVLLSGIGEILFLIAETEFENKLSNKNNLYEIIFNSFEPFFFHGIFPDMLSGRAITRENYSGQLTGHRILNSLILLLQTAAGEYKEKLEKLISCEIRKNKYYDYFENEKSPYFYLSAKELINKNIKVRAENKGKKQKCGYSTGVKICNTMNRYFKREEDFAIGIAIHSDKVGNYETMNGENEEGRYTGDGMYYLYEKGSDNYVHYWNNIDYKFIPGTTEIIENLRKKETTRNLKGNMIPRRFSGGIDYNEYAVITMDYLNWNERLSSRKSWVLLDGMILFVETGITGQGFVYTTVENRKFSEKPEIKINNKKYDMKNENMNFEMIKNIEINNLRYEFLSGNDDIYFEMEKKGKKYFVKIWVEHGENPQNKSFFWILKYKNQNSYEKIAIECNDEKQEIKYKKIKFKIILDKILREKFLIQIKDMSENKEKILKIEKCIYKIVDLQNS